MRVYINILFTHAVLLVTSLENVYLHFCSHSSGVGRTAERRHQNTPSSPAAGIRPVRCREICFLISTLRAGFNSLQPSLCFSDTCSIANARSTNTSIHTNAQSANTWSANKVFLDVIVSFLNGAPPLQREEVRHAYRAARNSVSRMVSERGSKSYHRN